MRKTVILLGAVVALLSGWTSARAQCVPVLGATGQPETVCGDFRPLRISPAVLGDPPLVWSASRAALVPLRHDGRARVVGSSIPLDVLIGRHVVPIGRRPEPVVYNNPSSLPGSVAPELILMRLPTLRRVVVSTTREVRVTRARVISVKD